MKIRHLCLYVGACVVLAGLCYWLRPERLFTNKRVHEGAPTAPVLPNDQPFYTGMFQGELHKTSGRASVFPSLNGTRSLQLTDFKTSNGPDLHVILVSSANVSADTDFALDPKTSIELGNLKGNEGDQNYVIPAGTNLSHYDVVSIYCRRFHANFGIARMDARP
jgi:Electron transfer DM13